MAVTKWDPFRDLMALQERMNRLFEDSISRFRYDEDGTNAGTWSPPTDIHETESQIILSSELPGLEKSDIDVQVSENQLTIQGERKLERDLKEENYHRIERSYGPFQRTFTLPVSVLKDKISASFHQGILRVTLPKARPSREQNHQVNVE